MARKRIYVDKVPGDSHGHPVALVSGDPPAGASSTERIAAARRRGAISDIGAAEFERMAEHGQDISILDQMVGGVFPPPDIGPNATRVTGSVWAAAYGDVSGASAPRGHDQALYRDDPLHLDMMKRKPGLVKAATADNPQHPRLFGDTDYPLTTASGMDANKLTQLPWALRRPVAAAKTPADVYNLVDKYSGPGGPEAAHADATQPGGPLTHHNQPYIDAYKEWLAGEGGASPSVAKPDDYTTEQLHKELFGGHTPV
jgi:hypothetical protein